MPDVVHDPVAFATIILSLVTFLLAVTTAAAVVVPIRQKQFDDAQARERGRRQAVALLDALHDALKVQMKEPAWSAAGGSDLVIARLLAPDIQGALNPKDAARVAEAAVLTGRTLANDDRREPLRRAQTGLDLFQREARSVAEVIVAIRTEIDKTLK